MNVKKIQIFIFYFLGMSHLSISHELSESPVYIKPLIDKISPAPWTSLKAKDEDSKFHFAIISDRTGRERTGIFGSAMEKVALMQPAFVLSVGDLIEGYVDDKETVIREWDELDRFVEKLDAPFFYTPGNHDYSNQSMADVWRERYGANYYSLLYKDVLFVVLNSGLFDRRGFDGHGQRRGDWDEEQLLQLKWLETTLKEYSDVRWTFLIMHRPYWRFNWKRTIIPQGTKGPWKRHTDTIPEWVRVEEMLEDRNYTAFAGHLHSYEYSDSSTEYHTHEKISLATTGGISNLRGLQYGEFDHFVWVTMNEDGPVIANILLDGVFDKNPAMPNTRPWWVDSDDNSKSKNSN